LALGDQTLLTIFGDSYSPEDYLSNHMVKVLIMAVEVGLGLGYNKSKLNELGLAAFLHDIGMIKIEEIALQPRALSEDEYSQIKEHPLYGVEILSQIKDIPDAVIYVVREEHERMNGKGYPSGMKNGEISEYARIIATADVYEALTHQRPHRKGYQPHEALKEMLTKDAVLFDSEILKVLVERVGIYPIGSWVELNTSEICKVIGTNDKLPLRPVLSLIFDSKGNRLPESRVVNLSNEPNLYVKNPLADEEIARKVKEEVK
jgi:HD-GYP domain-containing protein (c-di-GMP phosphodiesterase class II)